MTQPQKMKLYSDRGYLLPGQPHAQILFPFWGKNPEEPGSPTSGRYDRYLELGKQFFELVSLREADVAIFPAETGDWSNMGDNARRFGLDARAAGKPVAVFFWSDSAEPIDVPNGMIFRTSLYRSTRRPFEQAMPAWSEDFVAKYLGGKLPIRPKRQNPVVGFCGQPGPKMLKSKAIAALGRVIRAVLRNVGPPQTRTKLLARQLREGPFKGLKPSSARAQALTQLSKSQGLESNFIFKQGHFGGAVKNNREPNYQLAQQSRRDLLSNILNSDYTVCARGGGNFSYRLYETLCCGRIPIFVNTDCVLPYDGHINWKQYCVWVEEPELSAIGDKVMEFHSKLSPSDFIELQQQCRKLWTEWLSPEGFFLKFYMFFQ